MFVGNYEKAIDGKGRVLIPAPFRAGLGDQTRNIFAVPSVDRKRGCKVIWSEAEMRRMVQEYSDNFEKLDKVERDQMKRIVRFSVPLTIDENGRVQVPSPLITELGLSDTVIFAGNGFCFEMWEPGRFKADLDPMQSDEGAIEDGEDVMFTLVSKSRRKPAAPAAVTATSQGDEL